MAKVLFIIAQQNFRDEELKHPREVLKDHEITIASMTTKMAKGMLGMEVWPDIDIHTALKRVEEFDAVIFVGGAGSKEYFNFEHALDIARVAYKSPKVKVLGAICAAPVILANAGVLKDKRATAFPSMEGMVKPKCREFTGENVTVDGKIITAKGPEAAKKFGEEILKFLK